MDIPFHSTVMGRRFIEGTVPQVIDSLNTLNSRISVLTQQMNKMEDAMRRLTDIVDRIESETRPKDGENKVEMEPMSSR